MARGQPILPPKSSMGGVIEILEDDWRVARGKGSHRPRSVPTPTPRAADVLLHLDSACTHETPTYTPSVNHGCQRRQRTRVRPGVRLPLEEIRSVGASHNRRRRDGTGQPASCACGGSWGAHQRSRARRDRGVDIHGDAKCQHQRSPAAVDRQQAVEAQQGDGWETHDAGTQAGKSWMRMLMPVPFHCDYRQDRSPCLGRHCQDGHLQGAGPV